MRETHIDKQMMQVGLVGLEGRTTTEYAHRHHTQSVENRNTEYCHHQGYQPHIMLFQDVAATMLPQHSENIESCQRA